MTYTVIMLVVRKPGMSMEAFIDHYENKHVPLVLEALGDAQPVRHTRHYLKRQPSNGESDDVPPPLLYFGDASTVDYDCITKIELRDAAHFQAFNERFANSPRRKELDEDQEAFMDGSKLGVLAVEKVSITEA